MIPHFEQYGLEDQVWSVSDLNGYIRELIDIDYRLGELQVIGEVSNFSQAKSGHAYFTLKDDSSQIRCVMWASFAKRTSIVPIDGDAVVAHGRVSVYEAMGQYQLYVERLEHAGRGDLAREFEQLKQRLADEGLFDPEHKVQIPAFPVKIGIVTSADAAALRDIRTVLKRRWPLTSVLIAPTLVQGKEAPAQIVEALLWLDGRNDIDTIIVSRGGGSMEDLWAFNDEGVARAIFDATHPVIVGVGHETDFTIADFVADLRAPTPSAAAELAVPDIGEMAEHVQDLNQKMVKAVLNSFHQNRVYLDGLLRSLGNLSPRSALDSNRQRVDWLSNRLERSFDRRMDQAKNRLELSEARLAAVSPISTLQRGYAIVKKKDGSLVRSVAHVVEGEELEIHVADGGFTATVE
ncbi:MAG TPA: exodeoxyribonuclease VII large subunit [candidate division Zixibacteria bacterium]|nr:exodeoxyribonuclease VII large subunit [candidate division Zixibacteria bacterium]